MKSSLTGGGTFLAVRYTDKVSKTQNLHCLELVKQFKLSDKVFYCEK